MQGMFYVEGEKESRRRKSGTYSNTTKGTAKEVEKKPSTCLITESTEAL